MIPLQYMDAVSKKAGLNDAYKFALLRQAVRVIPYLDQFSIYGGAASYEELRKAVNEWYMNRSEYLTVSVSINATVGSTASLQLAVPPNASCIIGSKRKWMVWHPNWLRFLSISGSPRRP